MSEFGTIMILLFVIWILLFTISKNSTLFSLSFWFVNSIVYKVG